MYKILIRKRNTNRNLFEPYTVETEGTQGAAKDVLSGLTTTEYSTDDLTELAEKYKELLSEYTTSELKLIEELDANVIVEITDN